MTRRVATMLALVGAVSLSVAIAAPTNAAEPVWQPTVNVSPAAAAIQEPVLAPFNSGLAAVWSQAVGIYSVVHTSISTDGTTWSSPVAISAPGGEAISARLAPFSGGIAAIWMRLNGGAYETQVATSADGTSWTTPVTLSAPGQNTEAPQIIAYNGGLAAIWAGSDGGSAPTRFSTSPNGVTWSTPVTISTDTVSGQRMVVSGNTIAITWFRFNGVDFVVEAITSTDGLSFATTRVSEIGEQAFEPSIAAYAGGFAIGYYTSDAPNYLARVSTSATGATWGSPTTVSLPGQPAVATQIASFGSGLVAVYQANIGNNAVWAVRSTDGLTWGAPVMVSTLGVDSYSAKVTSAGSRVVATWMTEDASSNFATQAASSSDALTWETPLDLSAPGGNAPFPRVVAFSGGAAVSWGYYTSTGIVQAALLRTPIATAAVAPAALAATGTDVTVPVIAGLLLLLTGAALLRRRPQVG